MAKKKAMKINQKWLLVGAIILGFAIWWGWKMTAQEAQVALIAQPVPSASPVALGSWGFGAETMKSMINSKGAGVQPVAGTSVWKSSLVYKIDKDKLTARVAKLANFCMTYRSPVQQVYNPNQIYQFNLKGRITPIVQSVTPRAGEVEKREWTVTMMDIRQQILAQGTVNVAVSTSPTYQPVVTKVGLEPVEKLDVTAVRKYMFIKFCLDKSPNTNVNVGLTSLELVRQD
ncbi:MAG: hypothetical protein UX38_C0003G0026 [Microgenomates group bacterium GW2011_GWC1_46_16]|uniref:Uncharacterized protein n=2 Tax=Candidatus Collieribacteriota TaxID=1752725 RepID=A0A1F5FYP4_9BACT|nr:MAG: hypothetical protein UX32_C0002G0031 [Microgenomates group bacterium GW2011_GWF1_46_12]KKU26761.1 MAG: hypothetical protein UX38_C0003G0026 [Microgenomates group bacterium GW2011_GWC1_46_16]KKU27995.1 MAG: hypothetical protein UX40_C0004G0025 [Microgenomates group bacterium GW2011_GWF2_46_18]KKU45669.1 MAG: hypothetical protein UX63_C0002G0030 [Microgenomates group bacterium GW2011_GWB1_46_7]KKU61332.1 MAG: hypothetical protein UX84_C0019G0005 [Microgenomates group bacterium GW2011_GWD1